MTKNENENFKNLNLCCLVNPMGSRKGADWTTEHLCIDCALKFIKGICNEYGGPKTLLFD